MSLLWTKIIHLIHFFNLLVGILIKHHGNLLRKKKDIICFIFNQYAKTDYYH